MPNQRYKLTIAYRGTHYYGWQRQMAAATYKGPKPRAGEGIPTVQEIVTRAMQRVIGHPVTLVGSSRTDARVHAKAQLAHFDTDQVQIPPQGLRLAVNHKLPDDILIRSIVPVPRTFDAIRSTWSKRYQYFIWNEIDRPLFFPDLAWHRWQPLDVAAMREAASHFIGEHDFASFSKPGHKREHTVRTLHSVDISQRHHRIVIGVEGSGFLWQMVRIIVGTLVEVGMNRHAPDDIPRMLAAHDRRASGPTAPAHGLYLQWIRTYPEDSDEAGAEPTPEHLPTLPSPDYTPRQPQAPTV